MGRVLRRLYAIWLLVLLSITFGLILTQYILLLLIFFISEIEFYSSLIYVYMYVKLSFGNLNLNFCFLHPTNTCIYEVTIAWWLMQLTFQGKIQIWSWSKLLWLMFDIVFFFFFLFFLRKRYRLFWF